MRASQIAAAAALGVIVMSQAAQGAELVVLSTISAKEALLELVPEFERLLAESGSLAKFYVRARELAATKAEYRRFSRTQDGRTAGRTRLSG